MSLSLFTYLLTEHCSGDGCEYHSFRLRV